jgi:hypothetical protein
MRYQAALNQHGTRLRHVTDTDVEDGENACSQDSRPTKARRISRSVLEDAQLFPKV